MSDYKDRTKTNNLINQIDENCNDSSTTTTTTTLNSNRESITVQTQQARASISRSPRRSPQGQMDQLHNKQFEIKHLSVDDDEFLNDEYDGGGDKIMQRSGVLIDDLDIRGIVDYFDESELQPTTADMILDFDVRKVLESPEENPYPRRSMLKSVENTSDEHGEGRIKRLNSSNSTSQPLKSNMKKSHINLNTSPSKSNSKQNLLVTTRSINEIKRVQHVNSPKNKPQSRYEDREYSEQEDEEEVLDYSNEENEEYLSNHDVNKKHENGRRKLKVSAEEMAHKRMIQKKQNELEIQHKKQIKNLSKLQIQERQHLHQYPHPTQQQLLQQQQQMKLMFAPNTETPVTRANQHSRLSNTANMQTSSGYIIGDLCCPLNLMEFLILLIQDLNRSERKH